MLCYNFMSGAREKEKEEEEDDMTFRMPIQLVAGLLALFLGRSWLAVDRGSGQRREWVMDGGLWE